MHRLQNEAAALGPTLNSEQLDAFGQYARLLQEWNQRINLTAVSDDEGIRVRHFLDSLSCVKVTGDLNGKRLIDVGAGAGFPGLPLKIVYPQLRLTLLESVGKKTAFLQAVVDELHLTDVTNLNARAESVGQDVSHRERYDWAVARAVAPLDTLLEYLLPFCRVGGHALAMKGERATAELEQAAPAIATLGGGAPMLHAVQLPGRSEPSYLIVVKKVAATPRRYPRRPGIPAKRPL